MRAAYASVEDARDPLAWSGLTRRMAGALESAGIDLHYAGPLRQARAPLFKARHALEKLLGRSYTPLREPAVVRSFARQILRRIDGQSIDLVFSPSTIPVARLDCPQPIVTWTDATFACFHDYYPSARRLSRRSVELGMTLEREAIRRAAALIYASRWAADSAIRDLGAEPGRVHVVPLGASVTDVPTADEVRAAVDDRPADRCRILFIGVDFARKGGDVVIDAARAMNRAGMPTEVNLVGCAPPDGAPEFVKAVGFVNKFTPEGRQTMNRLLSEAHFLLMPSVAEAYGLAPCEANAYGVPALTSSTGGLAEIVRDGRNGYAFPVGTAGRAYADRMLEVLADPTRYRTLCAAARAEYEARLNWDAAGRHVRQILDGVIARRGSSSPAPADLGTPISGTHR
jgi:glycosyltransferase involved in cell wall biosynthesis